MSMTRDELHNLIVDRCKHYGVAVELAEAIAMAESNYNPDARGDYEDGQPMSFGAMQCYLKGACSGLTPEQASDPQVNIDRCVAYLKACVEAFPGDLKTAISAYNQGIAGARARGWEFTRVYVERVMSYLGGFRGILFCQVH